jgi:formate dehydrogenase subunit delta
VSANSPGAGAPRAGASGAAASGAAASGAAASGAGEHGGAGHGTADHLVKMANDIGHFFRAEPDPEDAIAGIANHIAKFWTKRMREKLNAHLKRDGDSGLEELPREALLRLAARTHVPQVEAGGGDAG